MTESFDGGCECGAIRYRLYGAPVTVNCCHCRDCQRITGSAFALNAMIESERIELLAGTPAVEILQREGAWETRAWRCGMCETLLWADHPIVGEPMRFVRAGTLDEGERMMPSAYYFVRSKHPWIVIPDRIPTYRTLLHEEDRSGPETTAGWAVCPPAYQ